MAVSNVHLVPAAWYHDTFHQNKNWSIMQTLSVKISYYLNYVSFISNLHLYVKTAYPTSQKLIFGANTNKTAMCCSVTSHFGVNFRDKICTCVFDFQRKISIALLIEFIFYTTNAYCQLKVKDKEI